MTGRPLLVFDIETYPDIELVMSAQGKDLTAFREDLKRRTGSDFLPPPFHIPIVIAFLRTNPNLSEINVEVQVSTPGSESVLLRRFWECVSETLRPSPDSGTRGLLVSFNGTEFDVPVLETRSLKYALQGSPLVRDPAIHFDVPLFLANNNPARRRGLNLSTLSKLVGLPGKPFLEGSQVQAVFERGGLSEIATYCLADVLQTYLIYLRCMLLEEMPMEGYRLAAQTFAGFLTSSVDPHVRALFPRFEGALGAMADIRALA